MVGIGRRAVLGLSVSSSNVRAVLLQQNGIEWAGQAVYANLTELAEVVARLAGESGRPVRRARIALERDVVQLRSVHPAPPIKPGAARRWVALEAPRLFRKNGSALATDAMVVPAVPGKALWAAATAEPLVRALLDGCAQAGLTVDGLGPAADVLPLALASVPPEGEIAFSNGGTSEVLSVRPEGTWRSRLVAGDAEHGTSVHLPELAPPLAALGEEANHYAPAYGAAVGRLRLELLPSDARATRMRDVRRRLALLAALATTLWLVAGVVYFGRLVGTLHNATQYLAATRTAVDSALALRRELNLGQATLATIALAQRARSRRLPLLAEVTLVLDDSTFLVTFRVGPDGIMRLAGYSASAARVLAQLERLRQLRDVRFEGPVTRETVVGNRELDRFAVVARLEDR
ncbi:MAG: hypothetical protein ACREMW_00025 [Gemmatimonadales bacterium]